MIHLFPKKRSLGLDKENNPIFLKELFLWALALVQDQNQVVQGNKK
jgi:hypothetical protein